MLPAVTDKENINWLAVIVPDSGITKLLSICMIPSGMSMNIEDMANAFFDAKIVKIGQAKQAPCSLQQFWACWHYRAAHD
jgi:hypothetical protein